MRDHTHHSERHLISGMEEREKREAERDGGRKR